MSKKNDKQTAGWMKVIRETSSRRKERDPYDESGRAERCPHCGLAGQWWSDAAPSRCSKCGKEESEKVMCSVTVKPPRVRIVEDRDVSLKIGGEEGRGDISFSTFSVKEILLLCDNGNIFVRGKLCTNDIEVVEAMREFLSLAKKTYH